MPLPAGWVLRPPLTLETAAAHAYRAGFRGEAGAIILAVAVAESSLIPNNRNVNSDSRRSVDRGILQINSYWHSEVPDHEADDPASAFAHGYRISAGGTSFKQWATYNAGNYKRHLGATRAAMKIVSDRAGAGGSLAALEAVLVNNTTGDILSERLPETLAAAPAAPLTIADIVIRGLGVPDLPFGRWVTAARLELSVDETSKLEMTIADPVGAFDAGAYFAVGTDVDLGELRFRVTDVSHAASGGALEELNVTCLAAATEKLRRASPSGQAKTWSNVSAAGVLLRETADLGLRLVAEGGPVYPSLTRLGRAAEDDEGGAGEGRPDRAENNWEFADRMARREGKWRFEAAGTLYYGRPSWMVGRLTRYTVRWRHVPGPGHLSPIEAPRLSRGVDEDSVNRVAGPRAISVRLPRGLADRIRPGMVMQYDGTAGWQTRPFVTYFGTPEGYLTTRVAIDLLDEGAGVDVDAREAVDPAPVPEEGDASEASGTTAAAGAPRSATTASALDMVTAALRQVGDTYLYGAEADPKDPDPDAFDCSELVQWACAQVGVSFVDGSVAQIAAIKQAGLEMTLLEASLIRGTLLWLPGHIAISLGDGKRTIEARGRRYGVGEFDVARRGFVRGGKIPGLDYGRGPEPVR